MLGSASRLAVLICLSFAVTASAASPTYTTMVVTDMHCSVCGSAWEIGAGDVAGLVEDFERTRGFRVDLGHLSVVGVCADCRQRTED